MNLSLREAGLIERLQRAGLDRHEAIVAVVMATYEYARIRSQLRDILTGYTGLERPTDVDRALAALERRGWLQERAEDGAVWIEPMPDLCNHIAAYLQDDAVAAELLSLRGAEETRLSVLGPMTHRSINASWRTAIRGARHCIRIPMLATGPDLEVLEDLRERANAGVEIRILLGHLDTVARWRGESQRERARRAHREWAAVTSSWPKTEVRVAVHDFDMLMASSSSYDGERVRIDVYDPGRSRSLDGIMLECGDASGLNLVRLFDNHFDEAWRRARPTSRLRRLPWLARRFKWEIIAGGALAAAATLRGAPQDIAIGMFGTAVFPAARHIVVGLRRWLHARASEGR